MKIVKDTQNNLMKRREIEFWYDVESNPGFEGAKKKVLEEFGVSEDVVVVKAVRSEFGKNEFFVDVFVYDSVEDKNKIEPKPKIKKGATQ